MNQGQLDRQELLVLMDASSFLRTNLILHGFAAKVVHVNGDVFKDGAPDRFTKVGFEKSKIPEQLFILIKGNHKEIVDKNSWIREGWSIVLNGARIKKKIYVLFITLRF